MNNIIEQFKGVLLTRELYSDGEQQRIDYWLKTEIGPRKVSLPKAKWSCFCPTHKLPLLEQNAKFTLSNKQLALSTFEGVEVTAVHFDNQITMQQAQDYCEAKGFELYETQTRPQHRFLQERFIRFGMEVRVNHQEPEQLIQARSALIDIPLKVLSLDIECSGKGQLFSIGLVTHEQRLCLMIGAGEDTATITYVEDEVSLLLAFVDQIARIDPDVIIGWAVINFDLSLLYRRAALYRMELNIGRGFTPLRWKVKDVYKFDTLVLPGRVVLDGIEWIRAAYYQFPRYSLEVVAQQLLGRGKATDDVDNRLAKIEWQFEHDKPALAFYNLQDCQLVLDIFAKTQLLEFAIERAKLTGLELGRSGASVAAFENLYLPRMHRLGFVAPNFPKVPLGVSPGGFVMNSIPGRYQNILVLDYKSLYPSIIRTFLIDPRGRALAKLDPKESDVDGMLGTKFSRDNPILPDIIRSLAESREQAKKEQDQPLSQAIKIIMNSMYGILGSKVCRFHHPQLASSITMRGHQIMKQTKVWLEELGHTVIYGDTDSTFVLPKAEYQGSYQALGSELVQHINAKWHQYCQQLQLQSFLELEFESHYHHFFMPTLRGSDVGSKKRYVGAVMVQDELQLTFKGMESVRSDWSDLAKTLQPKVYKKWFENKAIKELLSNLIEQLWQGKLDKQLVFEKRLKQPIEDYKANAPHVQAARILQNHLKKPLARGKSIRYLMTLAGAQPIECLSSPIDYYYYQQKQVLPIVEPILEQQGINFSDLVSRQDTFL
ncbi:DNA polymerase II [Paraferrimonas sp. SM1919]|uniref:DNA polymerase II n=1 Tax=Paraferrimonas sp. SM1919 TaxID=2662263 RepID=UPI0013D2AB3E|nr:DNA polymerase II [Paraferrimonas sp. SM1919]